MATNNYVALASTTASGSTNTISFTGISTAYTDLVIVIAGNAGTTADNFIQLQMGNGSVDTTGSNYSATRLYGSGSAASSDRYTSSQPAFPFGGTPSGPSNAIIQIMNYSNTTTYKTALVRTTDNGNYVTSNVQLWRSTSAVTAVSIIGGNNFSSTTTFSIYGIAAA
jgi:hypothetical protein